MKLDITITETIESQKDLDPLLEVLDSLLTFSHKALYMPRIKVVYTYKDSTVTVIGLVKKTD